MECILPVKQLKYAASLLSNIANIKSSFFLPYILIEASANGVTMSSVSLELSAKIKIEDVTVVKEGSVLVGASSFNGFAVNLQDRSGDYGTEPVLLKKMKSGIELKTKTAYKNGDLVINKARLEEIDQSTFPDFLSINESSLMQIDGLFLKESIDKTSYAISTGDDSMEILRGINMKSDGDSFIVTATNGRELSRYSRHIDLPVFDSTITSLISKNISKYIMPDKPVEFSFQSGKAFIRSGNLEMIGSLYMNDYPNVEGVLNTSGLKYFIVNKEVLIDAIRGCMPSADERTSRLNVYIKGGVLSLKAESSNETISDGIKIYDFDGEFSFDCNGWYLYSALAKVEGDTVSVNFKDHVSPIILRDYLEKPYSLTLLILPMRSIK